jgi:hypothetical protein
MIGIQRAALDSGASSHMHPSIPIHYYIDFRRKTTVIDTADEASSLTANGSGTLILLWLDDDDIWRQVRLPNVLNVLGLRTTLLSISALAVDGMNCGFKVDRAIVATA